MPLTVKKTKGFSKDLLLEGRRSAKPMPAKTGATVPTLPEIRAIRSQFVPGRSSNDDEAEKAIAALFTIDGAETDELEFLAICRALYRRYKETNNAAAVIESFIYDLVFGVSFHSYEIP